MKLMGDTDRSAGNMQALVLFLLIHLEFILRAVHRFAFIFLTVIYFTKYPSVLFLAPLCTITLGSDLVWQSICPSGSPEFSNKIYFA